MSMPNSTSSAHIAVIGLGYVGLPLAHAFSSKHRVTGFDIAAWRIDELSNGHDRIMELSDEQVAECLKNGMTFTDRLEDISECNIYIVTVPTPIDEHKNPDLTPLIKASESIGGLLKKGDIVIYESTVYPGCTEEVCVPVLEKVSGMVFNEDFFCGYSPERINPGDKKYTVTKVRKVTSGSTPEIARVVDDLYAGILEVDTHLAPSIKVAEAAKVIENSQRDINIAFVNELSLIFERLGIDTYDVLEAAGSKWNFLPFRPGLVGGHCIGVDPYYLTYKAKEVGYHPEVILAGRRINDNMGIHVAGKVVKLMIHKGHTIKGAKVLVLGITFKENCPDIRNSRVIDVIRELSEFGCEVDVYDPWADADEVRNEYGIEMISSESSGGYPPLCGYDAVILSVAHREFAGADLKSGIGRCRPSTVIFDVKGVLETGLADGRL